MNSSRLAQAVSSVERNQGLIGVGEDSTTPLCEVQGGSNGEQCVTVWRAGTVEQLRLPPASLEVVPGVRWGRFDVFFTPAFWISRAWIDGEESPFSSYSIGKTLREEVAACLLGGHGMPAEVCVAAFRRLRNRGLLSGERDELEIERALVEPLRIRGRRVRYRFPRTKASFVAAAMRRLSEQEAPLESGKELRTWLLSFRGVGPKTASWIARNAIGADDVAILDIHIVRAGLLMGLFSRKQSVQKDYFDMETRLVSFAAAVGMRLSRLDSIIWCYMRQLNRLALSAVSTLG
jgi:thermostable 8-oxoguanine DNA glycosylase